MSWLLLLRLQIIWSEPSDTKEIVVVIKKIMEFNKNFISFNVSADRVRL